MSIKAVIFDIGNVLYRWDPRFLYEKLIDDTDELDWFLSNVVTHDWHFQHDAGRAFADTSVELIAQYPDRAELIRLYEPRWLETVPGPVPDMLPLVERLADSGVPLFAISNFSAEFWEIFRPTAPIFDLFQGMVISGAERLVKPDPAIYRLALDRFDLEAGAALFIDDRRENIDAADALGIMTHHFVDAATLTADLKRRGAFQTDR